MKSPVSPSSRRREHLDEGGSSSAPGSGGASSSSDTWITLRRTKEGSEKDNQYFVLLTQESRQSNHTFLRPRYSQASKGNRVGHLGAS